MKGIAGQFAGRGIDLATAAEPDLVIDRFDNWANQSSEIVFNCFTGPCCTAPPLAETA
ncbi:hypothetical protein [Amycolatopsis sp. lyj-112]|uniref:hypothetical protein n=1 Tax=Amycolatopsis sp. lyj-112 TaxID=2789288 RepID=UPI00397E6F26